MRGGVGERAPGRDAAGCGMAALVCIKLVCVLGLAALSSHTVSVRAERGPAGGLGQPREKRSQQAEQRGARGCCHAEHFSQSYGVST
jgi:hypothetical protein